MSTSTSIYDSFIDPNKNIISAVHTDILTIEQDVETLNSAFDNNANQEALETQTTDSENSVATKVIDQVNLAQTNWLLYEAQIAVIFFFFLILCHRDICRKITVFYFSNYTILSAKIKST